MNRIERASGSSAMSITAHTEYEPEGSPGPNPRPGRLPLASTVPVPSKPLKTVYEPLFVVSE